MSTVRLRADGIGKQFNRRTILRNLSFDCAAGGSLAVVGRNGSGKSTFMKIIAGVLTPSAGTVQYSLDGAAVGLHHVRGLVGLVSPYLQLYDEFTALENLHFFCSMRGGKWDPAHAEGLLRRVDLWSRRDDPVRTYSSGMKQRMKYAYALLHRPPVLLLDEPTSNLDEAGCAIVRGIAEEQVAHGILLVATNDASEAAWCAQSLKVAE